MSVSGVFEAVFWDFGGVITSSPFERFNHLEDRLGVPRNFIRTVNATDPDNNAWARLERNEIRGAEFDTLFRRESLALGYEVPGADVVAALQGLLRPEMVAALQAIRGRYIQGCLTNNMVSTSDSSWVQNTPPQIREVMDLFDFVQESSAEGVRKPEPRFYELAVHKSGIADPSHIIFLDDLGINLKPARAMGMHTIKVGEPAQALSELQQLLGFDLSDQEH